MTAGPMTVTDAQIEAMLRNRASEADAALLGDIIRSIEAAPQGRTGLRWPAVQPFGGRWPRSLVLMAGLVLLLAGLVAAAVVGQLVNPPPPPMPTYHHNGMILVMQQGQAEQIIAIGASDPATRIDQELDMVRGQPAWSPDGMQLLYFSGSGAIRSVDVRTGNRREITRCDPMIPCLAAWSPDGSLIAVSGVHRITLVTPNGDLVRNLTVPAPASIYALGWSPDGQQIAFATDGYTADASAGSTLYVVNRDGGGQRAIEGAADPHQAILDLGWAPDGSGIAYLLSDPWTTVSPTPANLMMVDPDSGQRTLIAPAGACYCLGFNVAAMDWSPDGTSIAFGKPGEGLFAVHPDGSGLQQVGHGGWEYPSWRPVP